MSEPYRFLRNYEFTKEDALVFRGRKREAASLVSEITTRHLVILFAPTGTGKSSLINAAVRPALEELGYKTLYVHPKEDTEQSIRRALAVNRLLSESGDLAGQLREAARKADQPLVLFLDQFEEFFLYSACSNSERAKEFVASVAMLYRDRSSGIHFLFSLREDFFVEMDIFRDEIPTMFQANSSLRLRAFDREPAREAIEEPAGVFGVRFVHDRTQPLDKEANARFVNRVLDDLQATGPQGRISPIHLQIVCDTLWSKRQDDVIEEATYDRLGGVKSILAQRFRTDLAGQMDEEELRLFETLMPLLRSDGRGTKKVVPISMLPEHLKAPADRTNALVSRLVGLRLLHQGTHGTIEWASDYLSGRLDHLLKTVRSILLRRMIERAVARTEDAGGGDGPVGSMAAGQTPPSEEEIESRYMNDAEFEMVSNGWRNLLPDDAHDSGAVRTVVELTREQVRFLFEASLEHCQHLQLWYEQAQQHGIDVIPLLRDKVLDRNARTAQAESAIRLLVSRQTSEALEVLRQTLAGTALARLAAAELGCSEDEDSLALLHDYLHQHLPTANEAALMSRQWSARAKRILTEVMSAEPVRIAARPWDGEREAPAEALSTAEWEVILRRIRDGRVVPIIGMGSLSGDLARALAEKVEYPAEPNDLASVAEYAVFRWSKEWLCQFVSTYLAEVRGMGLMETLAKLPINLFITTRFDDVLMQSLIAVDKHPLPDYWHAADGRRPRARNVQSEPTASRPLVYYLQGRLEDGESAVLTTSERFELIGSAAADSEAIPLRVRAKFNVATPVFLDFEPGGAELHMVSAVFQGTAPGVLANQGVLVPARPAAGHHAHAELLKAEAFRLGQRPYWGSPEEFVDTLVARWSAYNQ